MPSFYEEYLEYCKTPSDINEHLPQLRALTHGCQSFVEFGVGYGRSTRAFLCALETQDGNKRLDSYDIKSLDGVEDLFARAQKAGLNAHFHLQSTLDADFKECDLLLVDSHHTYDQVSDELIRHARKVKKYIVFHDVVLYGWKGQDEGSEGILPAIFDWLETTYEWRVEACYRNNNGLLILEKYNVGRSI